MRNHWRVRFGEAGLWVLASMIVFSAHAGLGIWATSKTVPELVINEAVQSAIMIELAVEPETVSSEEQEIAIDDSDTKEVLETPQGAEQEPPEKTPQEEPVEEEAKVVQPPEPVEVEDPDVPDIILNIVPTKRPLLKKKTPVILQKPIKEPKPKNKTAKQKKQKTNPVQQARKQTRKAKVRAKRAKRTAARQSSRGVSGSNVSPARYRSRLMAHLERRKRYPSGSNNRGGETVYIRFRIDASGNVSSVKIARSSGNKKLDKAALDTVRRSSPVPPPPPSMKHTITAPIRFDRR